MKRFKISFMYLFFLFFILSAHGAPDVTPKIENTFPRDNTFCSRGKYRIEFLIRGSSKFTEDRKYGEYFFILKSKDDEQFVPVSETGHFRLLSGKSKLCTKGHGHQVGKDKYALLLQKDNRPFKDLLLIQLLDRKTLSPLESIQTKYPVDKAIEVPNGFAFRTYDIHPLKELTQVTYDNEKYLYQEKNFLYWINYTDKGFEINPEMTFKHFPYKAFFKNKEDFLKASGWDEKEKIFRKKILFHNVSHKLKKECVLFSESTETISHSDWICQTKNAE